MANIRSDPSVPAKQPLTVLAGPYGHPFHPILVTVPIGAWVGSLVLDVGSHASHDATGLGRAAYWLVLVGIIGAAAAAIFGLLDLLTIPRPSRTFRVGVAHMTLNVVILGLFVATFVVRHADGLGRRTSGTALTLSIIGLALLGISGWLGGMLSYRYGVRVASEATQAEGYRT